MNLPSGATSLKGLGASFEPNVATGTGSYSVAIELPPGFLMPTVDLTYAGGNGKSILGVSWDIPLLRIYRSRDKGAPNFDEDDRFAVSGPGMNDELVLVNRERGYYRLKNEGAYVLFVRDAARDLWEVRLPGRGSALLGETENARQRSRGRTYSWHVSRQTDDYKHETRYQYETDGGRLYPQSITYQLRADPQFHNHVVFVYEDRPDAFTDYSYGDACTTRRRLQAIEIMHGQRLLRRYTLGFKQEPLFSLLASVTLVGEYGERMPTLRFDYVADSKPAQLVAMRNLPPLEGLEKGLAEFDDVDGDGLPDLVYGVAGRYHYYRNLDGRTWDATAIELENSPDHSLTEPHTLFVDVNGDGFRDVVHQQGSAFRYYPAGRIERGVFRGFEPAVELATTSGGFHFGSQSVKLTDLNADGRIDLVWQKPGRDARLINGRDNVLREEPIAELPVDADFLDPRLQMRDFNGDGELDLVLVNIEIERAIVRVWYGLGRGAFTSEQLMRNVPRGDSSEFRLDDVNHDGQADLVQVSGSWATHYLNNGSGAFTDSRGDRYGLPSAIRTARRLTADMNGNGSEDLVWFTTDGELLYLDLVGDPYAGLLSRIDNGMGLVTENKYRSSTSYAIEARAEGKPWAYPLRTPVPVLSETSQTDSLDKLGMAATKAETSFSYRDGYYDAKEREFRGFGLVSQTEWGDDFHETLVQELHMHVGRNRFTGTDEEVLKGRPYLRVSRNMAGQIYATVEQTWQKRFLCQEDLVGVADIILPRCGRFASLEEHKDELVAVGLEHEVLNGVFERTNQPRFAALANGYDAWGKRTSTTAYGEVSFAGGHTPGEPFDLARADVRVGNDEVVSREDLVYVANDRWVVGVPYQQRMLSLGGKLLRASRTYFDGETFVGLPLGQLTFGKAARTSTWLEAPGCTAGGESPPSDAKCWVTTKAVAYDGHGQATQNRDGNGNLTELGYDPETGYFPVSERIHTESGPLEFLGTVDHARGGTLSRTDPNNHTSRAVYDGLGRIIELYGPQDGKEPGVRFTYQYGTADYPLSLTTSEVRVDKSSIQTSYFYSDGLGRGRLSKTEAEGSLGGYVGSGFVSLTKRGVPVRMFAPFQSTHPGFETPPETTLKSELYYDAVSRMVAARAPATVDLPAAQTAIEYLPFEMRAYSEREVALGHRQYPSITHSDGLGRPRVIQKANVAGTVDQLLRWEIDYAPSGEITRVKDPGFFSARLNPTTRHQRDYRYDSLGRMISLRDPALGLLRYGYDAGGNLVERIDNLGQHQRWEYELGNRLRTHFVENEADGAPDHQYDYYYDEADIQGPLAGGSNLRGEVAWVEFPTGREHFSYDEEGRVERNVSELWNPETSNFDAQQRDRFAGRAVYDRLGKIGQAEVAGGLTLEFGYNERDLPVSLEAGFDGQLEQVFSNVQYDVRGVPVLNDNGNGTRTCYQYDQREQLVGILTGKRERTRCSDAGVTNGVGFHHLRFRRGHDGLIAGIDDYSEARLGLPRHDARYSYDRIDQLVEVVTPRGRASYSYDELQNLIRAETTEPHVDLPAGSFGYGEDGAPPSALTSFEGQTLRYDAGGFLKAYNGYELDFDAEGRLARAFNDSVTIQHHYDASNELRLSIVTREGEGRSHVYRYVAEGFEIRDGVPVWLVDAGADKVEITESDGVEVDLFLAEQLAQYVAGRSQLKPLPEEYMDLDGDGDGFDAGDLVVAEEARKSRQKAGGAKRIRRYYHGDHLTSTTHITDSAGDLVSHQMFHPFGKKFGRRGVPGVLDFHGASAPVDPNLGLIRMGSRYYAPDLGRWISPDYFIGESPSLVVSKLLEANLYSFSQNNPVNWRDPSGNEVKKGDGGWYSTESGDLAEDIDVAALNAADRGDTGKVAAFAALKAAWEVLGAPAVNKLAQGLLNGRNDITAGDVLQAAFEVAPGKVLGIAGDVAKIAGSIARKAGVGLFKTVRIAGDAAGAVGRFALEQAKKAQAGVKRLLKRCSSPVCGCCFPEDEEVATPEGRIAIARVALGDRVLPDDPACAALKLAGWYVVRAILPVAADDDVHNISLLRSLAWLEEHDVAVGSYVQLGLGEAAFESDALIITVEPYHGAGTGAGCPVTGLFEHVAPDLMTVRFDGSAQPLEVTSTHPLYSVTRNTWIQAGHLTIGETLRTAAGSQGVAAIERDARGPTRVHNIEVGASHRYYVGAAQILAHNCNPIGYAAGEGASAFTPDRLQHASHHLIKEGLLPNWSKATAQKFIEMGTHIVENPKATFDHVLKGPLAVKGFIGEVAGKKVAILVYKEGKDAGKVATAIVPSPQQLANWGIK